jgi:signal transduction histidine kinase
MKHGKSLSPMRSGWMIAAIVAILFVFISVDWYYYDKTRRSLDKEFGQRLAVLAELVSAGLSEDPPRPGLDPWTEPTQADTALTAKLERLRETHDISNILIVREDGTTLASLQPGLYPAGETYPHWDMDFPAIMSALGGVPAATKLYEASRGIFLKAGYAPFPSGSGTARAVVAVEASPAFLEGLVRLRFILVVVTGLSVLGILLFTVFAFRAADSLFKARESLMRAETLATMGRMAAGLAHEIRNPLFIIRGAAEKLRDACPERSAEIESYVIEEVDRLNGTLTDYLLFARDEPGRIVSFDLAATLVRTVRNVQESFEGSDVDLAADFEIDRAPFTGEEKRLQQAFLNVILNARQAIEGRGRVRVLLASSGRHYIIRVADTGTGIPEKDLSRIFEPFFTTKTYGSGLGLAITKKVIEDHGGRIGIQSAAGAGTEVTITLPAPGDGRMGKIESEHDANGST